MLEEKKSSSSLDNQTLFPVDSLAKTCPTPNKMLKELEEKGQDFGRKCSESFAKLSQDMSLWKTSQLCWDGELESFSETWPRSGTMRNGIVSQRPMLEPLTIETEFGLWPTPEASLGLIDSYSPKTAKILLSGGRTRRSGALIGSSLKWEPRLYQDWELNGQKGHVEVRFVEFLMGVPTNYTDLNYSETAKSFRSYDG